MGAVVDKTGETFACQDTGLLDCFCLQRYLAGLVCQVEVKNLEKKTEE